MTLTLIAALPQGSAHLPRRDPLASGGGSAVLDPVSWPAPSKLAPYRPFHSTLWHSPSAALGPAPRAPRLPTRFLRVTRTSTKRRGSLDGGERGGQLQHRHGNKTCYLLRGTTNAMRLISGFATLPATANSSATV